MLDQVQLTESGPIWGGPGHRSLACPGITNKTQLGVFRGKTLHWSWQTSKPIDLLLGQDQHCIELEQNYRLILRPMRSQHEDEDTKSSIVFNLFSRSFVAALLLGIVFHLLIAPLIDERPRKTRSKNSNPPIYKVTLKKALPLRPAPPLIAEKSQEKPTSQATFKRQSKADTLPITVNKMPTPLMSRPSRPQKFSSQLSSPLNRPMKKSTAPKSTQNDESGFNSERESDNSEIETSNNKRSRAQSVATNKSSSPPRGLASSLVLKQVRQRIEALQGCYTQALKTDPNLSGQVEFRWVILPNGKVSKLQLKQSQKMKTPLLSQCLRSVFSGLRFPKSKDGAATPASIKIPFNRKEP